MSDIGELRRRAAITEGDIVKLSSGRDFYANMGILGIDPDGFITEGYDGSFGPVFGEFTPDERREIAEMMIARWRKWADAA